MKKQHCDKEKEIIKNLANNSFSQVDKQHCKECEICAQHLDISIFLNSIKNQINPPTINNHTVLYEAAKSLAEASKEEVILKPIKYMNTVFAIITLVMVFTMGYLGRGVVEELFNSKIFSFHFNYSVNLNWISTLYSSIVGKLLIAASSLLIIFSSAIAFIDKIEEKIHIKH